MPKKRIAMRKIHEILRLRFDVGLSFRQISQCADVSTGAIQKMLKRLITARNSRSLRGNSVRFMRSDQSLNIPNHQPD